MRISKSPSVGAILATAATIAAASVVTAAAPAMADSGQCGVRVSGPNNGDSIQGIVYTMRNKCSTAYTYRLYFPRTGRYSLCQRVGGGEYSHFQVIYSDPDWQIKRC